MKRMIFAAAMTAAACLAGCARDTEPAINGPDPIHRTSLPGTGPSPVPCPAVPSAGGC